VKRKGTINGDQEGCRLGLKPAMGNTKKYGGNKGSSSLPQNYCTTSCDSKQGTTLLFLPIACLQFSPLFKILHHCQLSPWIWGLSIDRRCLSTEIFIYIAASPLLWLIGVLYTQGVLHSIVYSLTIHNRHKNIFCQ